MYVKDSYTTVRCVYSVFMDVKVPEAEAAYRDLVQDSLLSRTPFGTGLLVVQDSLWSRTPCGTGLLVVQDSLWSRLQV